MKDFEYYLKRGDVERRSPDPERAKSLMNKFLKRANFLLKLKLDEDSATIIFEELYECLREACDVILATEGYNSYSHEASIAFLRRFKEFSEFEISKLDNFRKKRNSSRYYGAEILKEDAIDIIEFYRNIINKFITVIEKSLEK